MSFFEGVVGRVVGFVDNKSVRWEHYEVLRCRCGVRCGLGQRMKECKCASASGVGLEGPALGDTMYVGTWEHRGRTRKARRVR